MNSLKEQAETGDEVSTRTERNPKGRPKGLRNKTREDFLRELADNFAEHDRTTIEKKREDRPGDYIRMIASLIPKETPQNVYPYADMTDEQIDERIRELSEALNRKCDPLSRCSDRIGGRLPFLLPNGG